MVNWAWRCEWLVSWHPGALMDGGFLDYVSGIAWCADSSGYVGYRSIMLLVALILDNVKSLTK